MSRSWGSDYRDADDCPATCCPTHNHTRLTEKEAGLRSISKKNFGCSTSAFTDLSCREGLIGHTCDDQTQERCLPKGRSVVLLIFLLVFALRHKRSVHALLMAGGGKGGLQRTIFRLAREEISVQRPDRPPPKSTSRTDGWLRGQHSPHWARAERSLVQAQEKDCWTPCAAVLCAPVHRSLGSGG